jgi:predicted Zn-dependent protease
MGIFILIGKGEVSEKSWLGRIVSPIYILRSQTLVPQNVTVFGDRVFKEVIHGGW